MLRLPSGISKRFLSVYHPTEELAKKRSEATPYASIPKPQHVLHIMTTAASNFLSLQAASRIESTPRSPERQPTPAEPSSQLVPCLVGLGIRHDLLRKLLPRHRPRKRPRLQRHRLRKLPRNLNPPYIRIRQLLERGRTQIQIVCPVAAGTGVLDGHDHAVGWFARLPHFDFVAAEGVVVGVAGVVEAHGGLGEGGDEVAVAVLAAAGAEAYAWGVEGSVAFVDG